MLSMIFLILRVCRQTCKVWTPEGPRSGLEDGLVGGGTSWRRVGGGTSLTPQLQARVSKAELFFTAAATEIQGAELFFAAAAAEIQVVINRCSSFRIASSAAPEFLLAVRARGA